MNRELFTKIFLANIHRYTENVFSICTDCSLFTKFSSPIAFTCMVRQNFPHQIFPVYDICVVTLLKGITVGMEIFLFSYFAQRTKKDQLLL